MELVLSQNVDLLRISMQPDFHKIKRCFLSNTGQKNQCFAISTERSGTAPDAPSLPAPFRATLPRFRLLFGRRSLTSGTEATNPLPRRERGFVDIGPDLSERPVVCRRT